MKRILLGAALFALCAASLPAKAAAEPGVIKIGVVAELSGPFADMGKKIDDGIKLYLRQHGDTVAGKNAQIIVSNYGPGLDAEGAFTKSFTKNGGTIIGGVRVPMENPEFAPFLQRARDAKPDAVFAFVPSGDQGVAFMKSYAQRGLSQAGIKL